MPAFIDKNGNEFEGIIYTITIKKVKLEAKSQIDGPYNLSYAITTAKANATPTVERPPILRIWPESRSAMDAENTWVKPHQPQYDEILALVSEYRQDGFGAYYVSDEAYAEVQRKLGLLPPPEEIDKAERWKEQWEHRKNINAFQASTASISEDRIIDKTESQHVCFALDQWTTQMTDARDYVQEFREIDPETVEKNPGLGNVQHEAERALELLNQVECE